MKRKVVQQGSGTLMVSLPAEWAKKYGILKGDELEVEDKGRMLTIGTTKSHSASSVELDVSGLDPMIMRALAALYKAGYDEVKVKFDDPKLLRTVQNSISKEISGFEIIEQGKSHCLIRNIEGELEEGFDPILRRTFVILVNMAEDTLGAFRDHDNVRLNSIRFMEESNNRFTTFCRRTLSKRGYKEFNKIQFIYYIVEQLERQADQLKYLCDEFSEDSDYKMSAGVDKFFDGVVKLIRSYYELFYKFDTQKLAELGKTRKKLVKQSKELFRSEDNKGCIMLHYLVTLMNLTFEMVGPYMALTL